MISVLRTLLPITRSWTIGSEGVEDVSSLDATRILPHKSIRGFWSKDLTSRGRCSWPVGRFANDRFFCGAHLSAKYVIDIL
jgi:hypothetical protein